MRLEGYEMSEELKPCPFDGANAEKDVDPGSYGYFPPKMRVRCTKCSAASPYFYMEDWEKDRGTFSIADEAKRLAYDWWNRRA
jgi:hypothetical protein